MTVNWISHWAFLFHCLLVAFKIYEHSERQENLGLKLCVCPMYPEDRHTLCGKEEHCSLYFPHSVFENFFPNGARRDVVSSGRSCFWRYNFKTDLEERVFLQKLYLQVVFQVVDLYAQTQFLRCNKCSWFYQQQPQYWEPLSRQAVFSKKIILKRQTLTRGPDWSTLTNSQIQLPVCLICHTMVSLLHSFLKC